MIHKSIKQLRKSKERLSMTGLKHKDILDYMPYGCIYGRLDKRDGTFSFSIQYANKTMFRILAVEQDSTRQNISDLCTDPQIGLLPAILRVATTTTPTSLEKHFAHQHKWFSISLLCPRYLHVIIVFEEITEQKLLASRLKDSKACCEALIKQSSNAIALVDARTRNFVEVNRQLAEITGYSVEELCKMNLYQILEGSLARIDDCQHELGTKQYLPPSTRNLICKDGSMVQIERVVTLLPNGADKLELLTFSDVREERKLQQMITDDARLAGQVQQEMLPRNLYNKHLEVRGIFKPLRMVSGDFYDFHLSEDGNILTGFLVDVAGHGLATALQTAAINVLLQEIIVCEETLTVEDLNRLNQKMLSYFDESSFAALIVFRFNLYRQTLTVACCGINQFLASCEIQHGWIKTNSSVMGAFTNPEFSLIQIPLQPGDCFYFVSDGIEEILSDSIINRLYDFSATTSSLSTIVTRKSVRDDCSAVCVSLNTRKKCFQYSFTSIDEAASRYKFNRQVLLELAENKAIYLEMALNEAINNVLFHGSGDGQVRIKRIGHGLVTLRIKDCKQGFDADKILDQFKGKTVTEIADMVSTMESYRGILIMKLYTDKLVYNKNGTEVLLACKIAR